MFFNFFPIVSPPKEIREILLFVILFSNQFVHQKNSIC